MCSLRMKQTSGKVFRARENPWWTKHVDVILVLACLCNYPLNNILLVIENQTEWALMILMWSCSSSGSPTSRIHKKVSSKCRRGACNSGHTIRRLSVVGWMFWSKVVFVQDPSAAAPYGVYRFFSVRVEHRLTLFHLANDVIQYSKRKNYEFVESWGTTLQKATTMVR